ncbi:SMP-30/gluconolactonase/LRE family protein [Bradyrhizobium erythrophlei]|uniref:SMP-30/gluconolactonase/LRE family protein n=1 Tax=Bradyrhizobium erythrophlei TaxID=1437360 RepID=UPI0035EED082
MTRKTCTDRPRYELTGFVEGVWNPEDLVELPGTSWVIVSGMRSARHAGCLFKVDTARPSRASELRWETAGEKARLGPHIFDPHGIAARLLADGRFELLVVDHGGGEAIDRLVLELRQEGPVVVEGDRVEQPPQTSANAVAHLPDGGFVMTSMFDPADNDKLSRFARAEATGQVWRWSPSTGWSRFGDLQMSGANGIAVSGDGRSVIGCEWAARRVWRLDEHGRPVSSAETDFLPDNLRWTSDGYLLLAGQADRPEAVFGCEARGERCPLAFKVARVDPVSLAIEPLIVMDEADATASGFGGATGALMVGEQIWVGSFTGERIGIFAPAI